MTKTYTLALKLWSVHPKDLDAAGYIHKNHGGNYDNPRAAWYADQIQEYVNAAVAAVLEKAAEKFMSMCNDIKRHEKDNQFWTNGSENGQGYNSGLHSALNFLDVDEIRALIPTNALAEHDAKVRADTLREAVEIAIDERNKRGADKSTNGLWTAITRIQALIEGEA